MLNWKRKTSSSEKKFLNRSYCYLSTSHQHKRNWKKPELDRRSWSKAMKNSRKKWSNKLKKHKGWWNKWWRCSKNKPNLSCTTLACLLMLFVSLHVFAYIFVLLNYCFWLTSMCFWTMFMLLNYFYVMIMTCDYRISHYVFLISFFLSLFFFLLMTKGGVDV